MSERTVLIVDDQKDTRVLLRLTLRDWNIVEAADGDEGWARVQETEPDLAIIDWRMPGMTGPELVARMRREPRLRETPVIMLTGVEDGRAEAYRHGVDHYLTKPFNPAEVRAIVERAMRRHVRMQALIEPMMAALGSLPTDRELEGMGQALEMIGEIQQRMFRRVGRTIGNFEVGADLHPSLLASGDFFDVVPRMDGTWSLAVGDVSGKGPAAAFLMVMLRTALRVRCRGDHSLLEDVLCLNEVVFEETPADWFATIFCMALDAEAGAVSYANAGHWPVLIYHRDRPDRYLPTTGPALGIFLEPQIEIGRDVLEPGDIAVAVTDGVLDALRHDDIADSQRWLAGLVGQHAERPADEIAHLILDAARPSPEGHRDDQTVMVIKRTDE